MACASAMMVSAPVALQKSSFSGSAMPSLPVRRSAPVSRNLQVVASGKKTVTKTPNGPSGESKFKVDASGSPSKGKGTYQFVKKYGANIDGYSPIFTPTEWSAGGGTYRPGAAGLALWAVTFGALLLVGVFLVYSTSALSN